MNLQTYLAHGSRGGEESHNLFEAANVKPFMPVYITFAKYQMWLRGALLSVLGGKHMDFLMANWK